MHIEVLSVTIRNGLNALIAPKEIGVKTVEDYAKYHRYGLLYVYGNYSEISTDVKEEFDVNRVFTIYQLLSILKEFYHDVMFIEHDKMLFEDFGNVDVTAMLENLYIALKNAARGKVVIYYSTKSDYAFDYIAKKADRFIYFEKEPNGYFISFYPEVNYRKLYHRFIPKSQTTLRCF